MGCLRACSRRTRAINKNVPRSSSLSTSGVVVPQHAKRSSGFLTSGIVVSPSQKATSSCASSCLPYEFEFEAAFLGTSSGITRS